MKNLNTLSITSCLWMLIFLLPAHAQKTYTWSVDFDKTIEWAQIYDTGMMLGCSRDSLYGIDPEKKGISWQSAELKDIEQSQLQEIRGTPFMLISGLPSKTKLKLRQSLKIGASEGRFVLLNSYTGEFVFDSESLGWEAIKGKKLMLESGSFFLMGHKGEERILAKVNIFGGGLQWIKPVPIQTKAFSMKDVSFYAPQIDPEGHFIFSYADNLFRLNSENGDILWQQPYAAISNISFEKENEEVFYATAGLKNTLNVIDLHTGDPLWFDVVPGTLGNYFKKKEKRAAIAIKAKGNIAANANQGANSQIINNVSYRVPQEDDFLVVSRKGFNFFNKKTGKARWENPNLLKFSEGNIYRIIPYPDHYLAYIHLGEQRRFQLFDMEGKPVWKAPVQIKGGRAYVYIMTEYGLVYMSNMEVGILDKETGKQRMKRPFELDVEKGYIPYLDWEKGKGYVFQKNRIYEIDFATASSKEIIDKVKFKGDGKDFPSYFEAVEGGYFLANQQNFMKVDYEGNIVYQDYYRRPGAPMWLKRATRNTLTFVASVAIAYLSQEIQYSSLEAYYSGRMNAATTVDLVQTFSTNNPGNPLFAAGGLMSLAFDRIAQRQDASTSTQEEMLILARLETEDVGLIRIDKQTGKETGSLIIPDKSPVYAVDEYGGLLYYFPSMKRIEVFEMD